MFAPTMYQRLLDTKIKHIIIRIPGLSWAYHRMPYDWSVQSCPPQSHPLLLRVYDGHLRFMLYTMWVFAKFSCILPLSSHTFGVRFTNLRDPAYIVVKPLLLAGSLAGILWEGVDVWELWFSKLKWWAPFSPAAASEPSLACYQPPPLRWAS